MGRAHVRRENDSVPMTSRKHYFHTPKFISNGPPMGHQAVFSTPIKNRHLFQERRFIIVLSACPARFELATSWFVAMRSIQLGYGQKNIYVSTELLRRGLPIRPKVT